jgi:tRNA pseudouridine13 synthase
MPLDDTNAMPDPLVDLSLTGATGPGGTIRVRASDFLVDEIPLYDPCGSGEHLYLGIQKEGMPHHEMVSVLCRHFGVGERAIGHAGMKDRHAVTRQAVSIHLPGREAPAVELRHPQMGILWMARHTNKLKRGHSRGNRFSIRLREIDPLSAPAIWQRLRQLERMGVPDAFGPQRFGYRRNTHRLGRLLLERRWDDLVQELVGDSGSPFPERQRERRALASRGEWAASEPMWSRHDRHELIVLRALARGASAERAIRAAGQATTELWTSALQSATFNAVLARRLADGTLASLAAGDVACIHEGGACFAVTEEALAMPASDPQSLPSRLSRLEISPTGPMHGDRMMVPGGHAGEAEAEACASMGIDASLFAHGPDAPKGLRRPLRVPLTNPEIASGLDEHGAFVRMAFDLPPGAFATVVLRECVGPVRDASAAPVAAPSGGGSASDAPVDSAPGAATPDPRSQAETG